MTQWALALRSRLDSREPAALVSVLATEGSAPRGAGTRMIVTADAIDGTIGGGALEQEVIRQARALLDLPAGTWRVQDYPLGPLLGQCCGGRVRLIVEHVDPADTGWLDAVSADVMLRSIFREERIDRTIVPDPASPVGTRDERPGAGFHYVERIGPPLRPVMLFGAGHVGQAIARTLRHLPFSLAWYDTRPEMDRDGATIVGMEELTACIGEAREETAILILTHNHGLDYALTLAALDTPAHYVGLIGSMTKRTRFLSRLTKDGVSEAEIARLHCPIGLPGITGKAPDVIAVAVAAQLLSMDSAA